MAVSLGQHANARRYRAWLAQWPGATMTLVTDSVGAAVLDTWRESATPSTVVRAVIVAEPSVDAMVDVARRGADGADFTALLRPGCVGGDLRPPVEPAGAELFYGDEDHVDTAGRRSRPFFKPNFSLDLLLASDYFGACLILSRMLVEALPEGSVADFHSLALRLVERAERVRRLDGSGRVVPPKAPWCLDALRLVRSRQLLVVGPAVGVRRSENSVGRARCACSPLRSRSWPCSPTVARFQAGTGSGAARDGGGPARASSGTPRSGSAFSCSRFALRSIFSQRALFLTAVRAS